jgi:hypothetical protein
MAAGTLTDLRLAPLRLLWATLPLTAGPLFADALDTRSDAFRTTVSVALWVLWALTLVATLVPLPTTLSAIRVVVPAAVPAAAWAAVATDDLDTAVAVIGLVACVAVAIAVLVAPVGDAFVDGASYGDERRMPLRPPGALLLGPIELAWATTVAGLGAGPLLLAAQSWVAGVVVTIVGVPVALLSARALHRLTRRWVVFVPAGFVLHDHLALAEPMLFPRSVVASVGIAPADTRATDYTLGALGVAIEVGLAQPVDVVPARRDRTLDAVEIVALLFSPSRPGAVLREARRRRMPTTLPVP